MPSELDDIDRRLSELLARRIAVLGGGAADAGPRGEGPLPAFLLRAVAEGTKAALLAARGAPARCGAPRRVVVIGKSGVTGGFFARRLEAFGHTVTGFGRAGWGNEARTLVPAADLVLVSVPPDRVVDVVRRTAALMRPGAVLADVTSIKAPACAAMRESHAGPAVGLHPMFGPGVDSFLSQAVVVCHLRCPDAYRWLLDMIEADGGRLVECTPDEHDAMMVAVQALRHFTTMSLGAFLAREGIDVARSLDFASPVYRLEIDFVGRLFAQDAALYADIMLATPARREAIGRLAETFGQLASLVRRGDRAGLVGVFEETRAALGAETARALGESSRVIEAFGAMLAAREAERRGLCT